MLYWWILEINIPWKWIKSILKNLEENIHTKTFLVNCNHSFWYNLFSNPFRLQDVIEFSHFCEIWFFCCDKKYPIRICGIIEHELNSIEEHVYLLMHIKYHKDSLIGLELTFQQSKARISPRVNKILKPNSDDEITYFGSILC